MQVSPTTAQPLYRVSPWYSNFAKLFVNVSMSVTLLHQTPIDSAIMHSTGGAGDEGDADSTHSGSVVVLTPSLRHLETAPSHAQNLHVLTPESL